MANSVRKKDNDFLVQGGILAIASLLVRVIGLIYRIPMQHIIGSEGNGYYSTAFQVYSIMLLLSSYSLPLAVSKLVSARVSVGRWKESRKLLLVGLVFGVVSGLFFACVTYFGADFFCSVLLNAPMASIALKYLAPTVFLMGALGVLRGFFQGLQTTKPTAVSQILEQIVNAVISVVMALLLFNHGKDMETLSGITSYPAAWGAAGGTIGTGIGALVALLYFIWAFYGYEKSFIRHIKEDEHTRTKRYSKLFTQLVGTAVPIIFSSLILDCVVIVDEALFNGAMRHFLMEEAEYVKIWGSYDSAFLTLVRLPVSLMTALGAALVPSLSAAFAEQDKEQIINKIDLTVRITMILSIPVSFGMMAIGGNLAKLLYGSSIISDAQNYLVAGGLCVIFSAMATVSNAILHGLDEMKKPVIHSLIAFAVHFAFVMLFLYVFKIGIYAVIISYMIFNAVIMVMNLIEIYRLTGYSIAPFKMVLYPCIASMAMVILCLGITFLVSRTLSGTWMHLFVVMLGLLFGCVLYFVIIFKAGIITRRDMKQLPYGKKLSKIPEKLRLYKD